MKAKLFASMVLVLLIPACASVGRSSMLVERRGSRLSLVGPDAIALPVFDRYRYGVVLGSVVTESGERGCTGDAWLQPRGAPVVDVRPIAAARLQNMFRFPQLLPGSYTLGVRCMGFQPVRKVVEVRIGQVVRAVVTMRPYPMLGSLHLQPGITGRDSLEGDACCVSTQDLCRETTGPRPR